MPTFRHSLPPLHELDMNTQNRIHTLLIIPAALHGAQFISAKRVLPAFFGGP